MFYETNRWIPFLQKSYPEIGNCFVSFILLNKTKFCYSLLCTETLFRYCQVISFHFLRNPLSDFSNLIQINSCLYSNFLEHVQNILRANIPCTLLRIRATTKTSNRRINNTNPFLIPTYFQHIPSHLPLRQQEGSQ